MKRYFEAGASAWHYWNMVMPTGGMSGWGWPQNALVTVDPTTRRVTYNPDYWTIRHLSAFVARGARLLPTESFLGWDNQLAFANPDGSVVLVMPNEMAEPLAVRAKVGSRQLNVVLPAYSLNTFVLDIDQ